MLVRMPYLPPEDQAEQEGSRGDTQLPGAAGAGSPQDPESSQGKGVLMDKKGNSLETLPPPTPEADPPAKPGESPDWPTHLVTCAGVLRELALMQPLPRPTKRLRYIANDLEVLASWLRHPSNGV